MKADLGVHRRDGEAWGRCEVLAQGSEELCQPPVEFASHAPLLGLAGPPLSVAAGWVQESRGATSSSRGELLVTAPPRPDAPSHTGNQAARENPERPSGKR